MKEIPLLKDQINKGLQNSFIYKSALVHNVFRFEDYVVKFSKPDFPDFNSESHFLIESRSLDLIKTNGVPTPEKKYILNLGSDNEPLFCLVESFIDGIQPRWNNLNSKHLKQMFDIYSLCHNINVQGFGPLDSNLRGPFNNWVDFLNDSIQTSHYYFDNSFKEKILIDISAYLKDQLYKNEYNFRLNKSSFLLVDLNPGNMFFDTYGDLLSVIDIDHPVGGDEIYDYASIFWYKRDIFYKFQSDYLHLDRNTMKNLQLYSLIFGLNVMKWMSEHGLDIQSDIKKLLENFEEYKTGINLT